jgi:hypothetical protein
VLEQHESLTQLLAETIRELATLEAGIIRERGRLFTAFDDGRSITAIRDGIAAHVAPLQADAITLKGDVDALRAEIRHIEFRLEAG